MFFLKKNKKLIALFSAVTMLLAPASSIFASDTVNSVTPFEATKKVEAKAPISLQGGILEYNLGNFSTHIYFPGVAWVSITALESTMYYIDIMDQYGNVRSYYKFLNAGDSVSTPYTGVNGYHKVQVRSASNYGTFHVYWE